MTLFGLCCAPVTFLRLVETMIAGLQWDKCIVYLNDIIVVGKSFEFMMENLQHFFSKTVSLYRPKITGKEIQFVSYQNYYFKGWHCN